MTRRDLGTVFWALAGIWCVLQGIFSVTSLVLAISPSTRQVLGFPSRPGSTLLVITDLCTLAVILGGGIAMLARRSALAQWLFADEARSDEPEPALEKAPDRLNGETTGQLRTADLAAMGVAGVGVLLIIQAGVALISAITWWSAYPGGRSSIDSIGILLVGGTLGWFILHQRDRVLTWILGKHQPAAASASALFQVGRRLLGLLLIVEGLRPLPGHVWSAVLDSGDGLGPTLMRFLRPPGDGLNLIVSIAIGLVLLHAPHAMTRLWRAARSFAQGRA